MKSQRLLGTLLGTLLGPGVFYVGSIQTPEAGGPDTIGNNDGGSGAQSGSLTLLFPSEYNTVYDISPSSIANPVNAIDADATSYASFESTTGTSNQTWLTYYGFPGLQVKPQAMNLLVDFEVPQNNGNGGDVSGPSWYLYYNLALYTGILGAGILIAHGNVGTGPVARQQVSIALPVTTNPALVVFGVQTYPRGSTTGAVIVRVYGITLQVFA